jgi:hypothetical protein
VCSEKSSSTMFLNVDIDIHAEAGLDELLRTFGSFVLVLNQTEKDASFELAQEYSTLDDTLINLIQLVQSLPLEAKNIWNECDFRKFNIGIQCGHGCYETSFPISEKTLTLLASIQAEIAVTIYASLE